MGYITIEEYKRRSGVKDWKVYERLRKGLIKGKRDGKRILLDEESCEKCDRSLPDWTPGGDRPNKKTPPDQPK